MRRIWASHHVRAWTLFVVSSAIVWLSATYPAAMFLLFFVALVVGALIGLVALAYALTARDKEGQQP